VIDDTTPFESCTTAVFRKGKHNFYFYQMTEEISMLAAINSSKRVCIAVQR
jgi:hypothetical protein